MIFMTNNNQLYPNVMGSGTCYDRCYRVLRLCHQKLIPLEKGQTPQKSMDSKNSNKPMS